MTQVSFSAAAAKTVGSDRPFNVDVDVPNGYFHNPAVTPSLVYPIEVAAIANWNIPVSSDDGDGDAWPRVDLIPDSGVLLWILQGDVRFDYKEMPSQGNWFIPAAYTYLSATSEDTSRPPTPGTPEVVAHERGISSADRMESPWAGCSTWGRLTPLTEPNGETAERPPYLVLYVFAGTGSPPLDEVNQMIGSLAVRYS